MGVLASAGERAVGWCSVAPRESYRGRDRGAERSCPSPASWYSSDVSGSARPASFLTDLIAQVFSDRAHIDAERYCSYNGFLGLLLLLGAFAFRLSGPPAALAGPSFAFVVASALVLIAALLVPLLRPGLVPALLAVQGMVIVALTLGFAVACAAWAIGTPATHGFRYMPGIIGVGATYGAALWADFGPPRARPRPWRLAGFIAGIVLEVVVGALLLVALLRG
jgi:hypothetical protein